MQLHGTPLRSRLRKRKECPGHNWLSGGLWISEVIQGDIDCGGCFLPVQRLCIYEWQQWRWSSEKCSMIEGRRGGGLQLAAIMGVVMTSTWNTTSCKGLH